MADIPLLHLIGPIILLLFLGVVVTVLSRAVKVSPIVGYIALGIALKLAGFGELISPSSIGQIANLGVMFLLFEIGLHFSLQQVRKQASDIFAFGPVQMLFATVLLALVAVPFGLRMGPALLVGSILALSSTAVVGRLIAERHQQNCPVGLTATSILIFQDVAAILLLIIAGAVGHGTAVSIVILVSLAKAAVAFALTIVIARYVLKPVLGVVARTQNEDIFTAVTLLVAMAAGAATGEAGLSLTLGTFLGGIAIAETPYRAVIEYEIKPFRGLFMGCFFVSVGLSMDVNVLAHLWPVVIALTALLFAVKGLSNIAASRVFRWSVPGSTQLGFLLSQADEFAFVLLSLGSVQAVIGVSRVSVLLSVVGLSMALAPTVAELGRRMAGRLRAQIKLREDAELVPQAVNAPAIIIGMGTIGRLVADGLIAFGIDYYAVENDERRLRTAIADGYKVAFGDGTDIRLLTPMHLHDRKLSVLTAPDSQILSSTGSTVRTKYPQLKRFAFARTAQAVSELREIGLLPYWDHDPPLGFALVLAVLTELGVDRASAEAWLAERQHRSANLREMTAAVA